MLRGLENELVLDKHSFQLVDCPTALSTWDFYNDEQKIHDVYYKEMEEVLKKYTGCEYVHVFHHQVIIKKSLIFLPTFYHASPPQIFHKEKWPHPKLEWNTGKDAILSLRI